MSKVTKILTTALVLFATLMVPISGVNAQDNTGTIDFSDVNVCTFIKPICDALGIQDVTDPETPGIVLGFTQQRVSQVVSLVFIGIILISVFIIVQSGVKYIQSQGEEGKIQEAQKAIRSVFIGIAVLFVGIIGLILLLAFFNASGLVASEVPLDEVIGTQSTQTQDTATPQ